MSYRGNVVSIYDINKVFDNGVISQELDLQGQIPLYGSSRYATLRRDRDLAIPIDPQSWKTHTTKQFEMSNHLGNVLSTVSARREGYDTDADGVVDFYEAEVISAQDYYAFGLEMPARTYSNTALIGIDYRYGFNGKERDADIHEDLTNYNYGFRIYNPGIARFLSVDPLAGDFAGWSPYNYVLGNPIKLVDPDGRAPIDPPTKKDGVFGVVKGFGYAIDQMSIQLTGRDLSENAAAFASLFPEEGNFTSSGNDAGAIGEGFEALTSSTLRSTGSIGTFEGVSSTSVMETNEFFLPRSSNLSRLASSSDVSPILRASVNMGQAVDQSVEIYGELKPRGSDGEDTIPVHLPRTDDTVNYRRVQNTRNGQRHNRFTPIEEK